MEPGREAQPTFRTVRSAGSPISWAADWGSDHTPTKNQSIDYSFVTLAEAARLRNPGAAPTSSVPVLTNVPLSSGFLAQRAVFDETNNSVIARPTFPTVSPYSSYSGNASDASWLASMTTALAYQAFTSTDASDTGRTEFPRSNALKMETPSRFQNLLAGDSATITVNARQWPGVTKMEFYLDDQKLGERTDGTWAWTLNNLPAGFHSLVAIATDGAGNQRAAFTTVTGQALPEKAGTWTGATNTDISNSGNWSGDVPSAQRLVAFNGSASNRTVSTGSAAANPRVFGLLFENAAGDNGFTLQGWRAMYLGAGGIRNLDESAQTINHALWLAGPQTWAAVNGPITVGAEVRLSEWSAGDGVISPIEGQLTISGAYDVTINAAISKTGGIIKEGTGTLTLNGANTFGDYKVYWYNTPAETLRVHSGTVRLGASGSLSSTNRVFVADVPGATFDLNGKTQTLASLEGAGVVNLGAGGKLTLTGDYDAGAMNCEWTTIKYRGSIQGGTSGVDALVKDGTALTSANLPSNANSKQYNTRDLYLSGNSTYQGITRIVDGNLYVGHSNALGAGGTGNHTVIGSGVVAYLDGSGMTVPENWDLRTANNAIAIENKSGSGSNTLSGRLAFNSASVSGSNQDMRIRNMSGGTTLTLSGVLSNDLQASENARVFLEATNGAKVDVTGSINNGANGAPVNLFLRNATGSTSGVIRLAGQSNTTGGWSLGNGTLILAADAPSGSAGALGAGTGALSMGLGGTTQSTDNITVLTEGAVTVGRGMWMGSSNSSGQMTIGGSTAHVSAFHGAIDFNSSRNLRLTAASGGRVNIGGIIRDSSYSGSITKFGAGIVNLANATGNAYDGATLVSEGTLLVSNVSGSATGTGSVTVQNGAHLGGTGRISGPVTIESGGNIDPGESPGTLYLSGGVTLSAGAKLNFELGSASDLLRVLAGTLTGPSSGTVMVNLSGSLAPSTTYTLIDWTGATTSDLQLGDFVVNNTPMNGNLSISGSTLRFTTAAVPEPAGLVSMLSLAGLAMGRRRRRA